ncbi:hypothetical protein SAMN05216559_1412 [Halomicrobium zhouii]|uniref:Uncharacterized protein n=1 Tax=Halomicrobium zhouii TaxID=767519 RepID=A0A1I6KSD4_9EURY|nr:hypothetical protein [Halomicrobium zhouii]SFR93948.1 hypothetical protein SAMN05216559_1412 [Halomicrobium zhouii]
MSGDTGPDGEGPMAWWDDLLADADDQVAAYEKEGWDAHVLHPGDVTPLDGAEGDRVGLSILLPDDEYERVARTLAAGDALERYDVYRTTAAGHVALLLALETGDERAFVCPAYYALDDEAVEGLFTAARSAGTLSVYLRRLDGASVEVTLDEPSLLAPPAEE